MQERQRLSLCLQHTLNNLCQEPKFCKQDLDRLANGLTPPKFGVFSPHFTPVLGNYDVNVLEAALLILKKVRHPIVAYLQEG